MLAGAIARLVWTSFSMALALSRIAVATVPHLASWSGVILSEVFSVVMRCSTVSGLLLVAAAAAGGLSVGVCAATGPSAPVRKVAPNRDAMASERTAGASRGIGRNKGNMGFPLESDVAVIRRQMSERVGRPM